MMRALLLLAFLPYLVIAQTLPETLPETEGDTPWDVPCPRPVGCVEINPCDCEGSCFPRPPGCPHVDPCDCVPQTIEIVKFPLPPLPSPKSCMSGNTGLIKFGNRVKVLRTGHDDTHPHAAAGDKMSTKVKKLIELEVGDKIKGFNDMLQPAVCNVEAMGKFGHGVLYGNYTKDHFVFNPNSGQIEQHGESGEETKEDKYEILTSCPLGVDESGKRFTPIDSDFCGKDIQDMSWSDYVLLHGAILRVVRKTGGYWFNGASYSNDMADLHKYAPGVCSTMLRCVKNDDNCDDFEDAAMEFIENTLEETFQAETYALFPNAGMPLRPGSVSATVTGGRSVR